MSFMNNSRLLFFSRIIKVLGILLLVLFIVGELLIFYALLNPGFLQSLFASGDFTLSVPAGAQISVPTQFVNPNGFQSVLFVIGLELFGAAGLSFYLLWQLNRLLKATIDGKPFVASSIQALKGLAWVSLIVILVSPALNALSQYLLLRQVDLSQVLVPGIDYSIRYEYSLELTQLIIPLFLFALVRVFQYGQSLQQFSDDAI